MTTHDPFRGYDQWKTASPYDDQEQEWPGNDAIEAAFSDFVGPYDLYRQTYKCTDCGPSVGFLVAYTAHQDNGEAGPAGVGDERREKWIYCDDLIQLKDWQFIREQGIELRDIGIGSIVEGSHAEIPRTDLGIDPFDDSNAIRDLYWQTVSNVNAEACALWDGANQ